MELADGELLPTGEVVEVEAGACLPGGFPPECAFTRPETRPAIDARSGLPTGGVSVVPGWTCPAADQRPEPEPEAEPGCERATERTARQAMQLVDGELWPTGAVVEVEAGACLPGGLPPECAFTRPETRPRLDAQTGLPVGGVVVVPGGPCSP
jgi:hypothetical protein